MPQSKALRTLRSMMSRGATPPPKLSTATSAGPPNASEGLGPEYVEWCGSRRPCSCNGTGIRPCAACSVGGPPNHTEYCPCPAGWALYCAAMAPIRRSFRERAPTPTASGGDGGT
jgi:hypothetical protein